MAVDDYLSFFLSTRTPITLFFLFVLIPFSHRDLFGFSATRTDHEIISREIKTAKCPRTKDSRELVSAIQEWDFLKPTRINSSSCEHRVIHVAHACKNIRLRIHLEEVGYDEFCSSEVDEPVGDDGDVFIY
jgi:hypothetical protein